MMLTRVELDDMSLEQKLERIGEIEDDNLQELLESIMANRRNKPERKSADPSIAAEKKAKEKEKRDQLSLELGLEDI